jgi:hypothetical protein
VPALPPYINRSPSGSNSKPSSQNTGSTIRSVATGGASPITWSSRSWSRSWCSAAPMGRSPTGPARRAPSGASEASDEWIELGLVERLRKIALAAYDRYIGLEPSEVAVDCCITKAPCGGEKAGRNPVDRAKGGLKRSVVVDGRGIPLGTVTAPAKAATTHHSWLPRWTSPKRSGWLRRVRPSTWTAATTPSSPGRDC